MGFIKTTFLIIIPISSYSIYLSYKLGQKLPIICRKTGNNLGMFYRYIRIILNEFRPPNFREEIIDQMQKQNFKIATFQRESQKQIHLLKEEFKEKLPEEMIQNPYEKFYLKDSKQEKEYDSEQSTAEILRQIIDEQKQILKKNSKQLID